MSRKIEKYLTLLRARYAKANRQERSVILDEFIKTTGYHRKYAVGLLIRRLSPHSPREGHCLSAPAGLRPPLAAPRDQAVSHSAS